MSLPASPDGGPLIGFLLGVMCGSFVISSRAFGLFMTGCSSVIFLCPSVAITACSNLFVLPSVFERYAPTSVALSVSSVTFGSLKLDEWSPLLFAASPICASVDSCLYLRNYTRLPLLPRQFPVVRLVGRYPR